MELAWEEQLNSREFAAEQRSARAASGLKDQAKDKAVDEFKKQAVKMGKQAVLRIINATFAATVVGILITWAIMSVQIFVGNLLGVKTIALEGIEIGIYAALSFLILTCLIIIFIIISFALDPWQTAVVVWDEAWNKVFGK